mgnify:CR=1 FL=1
MAASSIANIVKSSLGPVGLDKMLVDDVGVSFPTVTIEMLKQLLRIHNFMSPMATFNVFALEIINASVCY